MTKSIKDFESVIMSFLMEPDQSQDRLLAYIKRYPHYSDALISAAADASLVEDPATVPISKDQVHRVESTLETLFPMSTRSLNDLTQDELLEVAEHLRIPKKAVRQLKMGRAIVSTIPAQFLNSFAECVGIQLEALRKELQTGQAMKASYKSSTPPASQAQKMSFTKLLEDCGATPDQRAHWAD